MKRQRSMSDTLDLLDDIDDLCYGFNEAELRVLLFVAERLTKGRRQYGPLNPDDPAKDWRLEHDEELADALVYSAAERLRGKTEKDFAKGVVAEMDAASQRDWIADLNDEVDKLTCPECDGTGWIETLMANGDYCEFTVCECQRELGGESG